jgi:predicted nucleic acid-binding protein
LLDTDVVSQRVKATPDPRVMQWLGVVPQEETYISVVTIQELRTGVDMLPAGRKRRELESWLVTDIPTSYAGRILPITEQIADVSGRMIAQRPKAKETPGIGDVLLAATAKVHGLKVATLNRRHFEKLGVELVEF